MKMMKKMLMRVAMAAAVVAGCLGACACGTGTTLTFAREGIVVTPPAGPVVIPVK